MATFLIVDDNAGFRRTARALLESEGWEVAEADTAGAGVESARTLHSEFVLLDLQLPDFDGFEAAARMALIDPPPVVILTSSRDGDDYGSLIATSAVRGFIPKGELSGETIRALLP
ncbi:MAG TPA: response regulator [Gaiellaceae bacterium]|jgi:CheY-like chemotaxis protein|nr:response regulator [Gaiellaceae bacterium]